MTQGEERFWRMVIFPFEAVGAILLGVPLALFIGLCGALLIYFLTFRILGQELQAMWRKQVVVTIQTNATLGAPEAFQKVLEANRRAAAQRRWN